MRKYRVKSDVKKCMKHFLRCGGQRAVECGDDPPGGLSTLSAQQMAHGGVIPHSSSSELSAHQMLARVTSAKGYLAMMATVISLQELRLLFGAKTGKGRARGHDVSAAPSPNLSEKGECEDTRCVCRPSPGSWMRSMSFASIYRSTTESMISNSRRIVGPDAKAMEPRRLSISRVLVGLSMMHAQTPVMRVKLKKRTRHRAPHDSSTTN